MYPPGKLIAPGNGDQTEPIGECVSRTVAPTGRGEVIARRPGPGSMRSLLKVWPLLCIIAAAVAARSSLLFGTQYMPGVNGAYYLVQARALLERGVLGIPDMPLTFYVHAGTALLLAKVSGMAQSDAIVWAVKLTDVLLPPLAAWPVFVLVRGWARSRQQGDAVALAAAALACLASPWFMVVGDLQKNSLALVWLAMLAVALHRWLGAQTLRRGSAVLACLMLLGLTHVGVLGAALVLLAAVMLVFVVIQRRSIPWRRVLPWVVAGTVVLALTSTLVLWKFDPARIHRLTTALTDPVAFSSDGKQAPAPPGGETGAEKWFPSFGFALVALPGLFIALRRKDLSAADVSLVAGGALTVLALTGPWFGMDKAIRFYLIAFLPAIVVGGFSIFYVAKTWLRHLLLGLLLLVAAGGTVQALLRGRQAILNDAAMRELQSIARDIPHPERTLLATQHGAEWWSAWFLHTHIAQTDALQPEDWKRYDTILFLEVKSGAQGSMPGGGGGTPGFGQRPASDGPNRGAPDGGRQPMIPPLIPPDAEVLHDGAALTLARIVAPPDFVVSRRNPSARP
jgi:hypothetical protein